MTAVPSVPMRCYFFEDMYRTPPHAVSHYLSLPQILQIYASEAIFVGTGGVSTVSAAGQGFGKESSPGGAQAAPKRTPARVLLDEILTTDADKWDGILKGLSTSGQGLTGGVTKEGLLGAIQVRSESYCRGYCLLGVWFDLFLVCLVWFCYFGLFSCASARLIRFGLVWCCCLRLFTAVV